MVFSSLDFLYAFLPLTLACYAVLPRSLRNALILAASLVFYYWTEGRYVGVLLAYIVGNWAFGRAIGAAAPQSAAQRALTTTAVLLNVGGLVLYKYAGFIASNIGAALNTAPAFNPDIHLPIGISFFAFQGISYVVDISRGEIGAARSLITFGAYKTFFPQLIAGPIVRFKDVASDFVTFDAPTSDDIAAGGRRFIIGLAKKVLIANSLAVPADMVFDAPAGTLTASMVWFGTLCYALQLYFDFSGYSDMAIGLGRLFGIHIRENFQYPYVASSVREFWRRWHISLSTWFRDYVFLPLGGSRRGPWRTIINLWIVFLLCGIWHGAQWTFVMWGAWHGLFLSIEHLVNRRAGPGPRLGPLGFIYTVLVVMVGWVFFRAHSLEQAVDLIGIMAFMKAPTTSGPLWLDLAQGQTVLALLAGLLGCTPWPARIAGAWRVSVQNTAAFTGALASTLVLASSSFNPFIYFRF